MGKMIYILLIILTTCCAGENGSMLHQYEFSKESAKHFKLPGRLREISGLAYAGGNLVYCHNDERSIIYIVDTGTGEIVEEIDPKGKDLKEDFEGIAYFEEKIYLTTSEGDIYVYPLKDGEKEKFKKYKTPFASKNDVEGLCCLPEKRLLLMVCKEYPGSKKLKGKRAVYPFDLDKMELKKELFFAIDLDELKDKFDIKSFYPSSIERNPLSGTYFLTGGKHSRLVEVDSAGKVLAAVKFNKNFHPQPEGITFLPDGTMIIADEGPDKAARLSVYKLK